MPLPRSQRPSCHFFGPYPTMKVKVKVMLTAYYTTSTQNRTRSIMSEAADGSCTSTGAGGVDPSACCGS